MMNDRELAWATTVGFFGYMMGTCVEDVGRSPHDCDPYTWMLPVALAVVLAIPFVLGRWTCTSRRDNDALGRQL